MTAPESPIRKFSPAELTRFVEEHLATVSEEQAIAILENRHCNAAILQIIGLNPRLTSFYSVRLRLVAHRATPQAHSLKFVHYLFWQDLLRLSIDVRIPATVRRAIDKLLLLKLDKLSLGEKISAAKRCGHALISVLIFDRDPKVFAALLNNARIREDDLIVIANSSRATAEQLIQLAANQKWSFRYSIRKALVMNPKTPRAVAASQLRYLSRRDLVDIHSREETSVYLRRCIERMHEAPEETSATGG
jgi:hypothetical protein